MENLGLDKKFWKNKKVFVTGASGFKGGWLSLWLKQLGAKVTGYSLAPTTKQSFFTLTKLDKIIKHVMGDINDYQQLEQALVTSKPDIILHLAAQAIVGESYNNPINTLQTNIIGTANLLEIARNLPCCKAVVVITTDKCYENKESAIGYKEDDRLGGSDPYSASKACTEIVINCYRQAFAPQFGLASCRAGNVIGGGDFTNSRLVPDLLTSYYNGEPLVIRNPEAIRPWQYVLDPLYGYLLLAQKLYLEPERYSSAWNFGPKFDHKITVKSVLDLLVTQLSDKLDYLITNTSYKETISLSVDASKARHELNWDTIVPIPEALQKIVTWHNNAQNNKDVLKLSLQELQDYEKRLA